jgi:hypothetical protein
MQINICYMWIFSVFKKPELFKYILASTVQYMYNCIIYILFMYVSVNFASVGKLKQIYFFRYANVVQIWLQKYRVYMSGWVNIINTVQFMLRKYGMYLAGRM